MTNQRGMTLIELMIAMVIFSIVGGLMLQFIVNTQRLSRDQAERADLQGDLRTGALLVPSELREVGISATASDLQVMGANAIQYRAMRGFGVTCAVGAGEIRLLNSPAIPYSGVRRPFAARDRLLLFAEGDPATPADDSWADLVIVAVNMASTCGARPAIALTVAPFAATLPGGLADIVVGGPARIYEVMRLESYAAGGRTWLGARSVSAGEVSLMPVLGPLAANGFQLAYLDANGNPTANSTLVRSIRVTLRGLTSAPVSRALGQAPAIVQDSLVTLVALRNAGP